MGKPCWLIATLLCVSFPLASQDIDTTSPSIRQRSPETIAEQIEDKSERAAFLSLFRQRSPLDMEARADAFVTRYPQSAFLAQAYEVAARASFDLQRFESGLEDAEKSLALLPENPPFLVVVADVEAHQERNHAAIVHSEEALESLSRFAPPSTVAQDKWPALQRSLKASATFSKGRALLQEALLVTASDKRNALLRDAVNCLLEVRSFNEADLEATYVLGLAQLAAGESSSAADNFSAVFNAGGEFAPKALENLRAIYRFFYTGSETSFEGFLVQVKSRGAAAPVHRTISNSPKNAAAQRNSTTYAGSTACKECHVEIYKQWSESGMSKMFRPYEPQNVIGDFLADNQFFLDDYSDNRQRETDGRPLFARMVLHDGRPYFEIKQSPSGWHKYPVDYTIGSKFQQAYATRLPNGEIHVFPIQYNRLQRRWINFWKIIDGTGSERSDPRNWEKLDGSSNYLRNCSPCHTSQLRNARAGEGKSGDLEFKEPGINCEMCHGPSAHHAVEMAQNQFYPKAPQDPPVNFGQAKQQDAVAICAQCHMQSALREANSRGELNYSTSGEFFQHYIRAPFGEFSRRGFYKDGRFRQSTFIVESLERSKCFKKGNITCGTCHDPHGHDSASNPASVKFRDNPDLMCVGCHTEFKDGDRAARHSHHLQTSEGSRCASCHMPRIMEALMFRARSHQIDDIPNAKLTKQFGQEESPNSCLACHSDKSIDWVEQQLSMWRESAGP